MSKAPRPSADPGALEPPAPVPSCVFCQIAAGKTPAHRVLEDEAFVAFLDARPVFHGHCLLIPKLHYETLADLPSAWVGPLFERAKSVSAALPKALGADGSFVALNNRVSQSVPHLHVHVVPRRKGDGLRGFFWPRHKYESEDAAAKMAAAIRSALGAP